MTGGNARHNASIDQLVVQEALRILQEKRQMSIDPNLVRRYVHDELRHYKVNEAGRRNGNVDHSDFQEILEHTVSHFAGRVRSSGPRTLETTEDVNWRIEDLIEEEFSRPANAETLNALDLERYEQLRATMRTRLRAEFAQILMNEAYTEHFEEVADFFRGSIVSTFEERAPGIMSAAVGESSVCSADVPTNNAVAPAVVPAGGPAVRQIFVDSESGRSTGRVDADVVRIQLVLRYPRFLSQTAREALLDNRPLPSGAELINSSFATEVTAVTEAIVQRYAEIDRSESGERDRLWREEAERGLVVRDGVPDALLREVTNAYIERQSSQNGSPFGGGAGAGFRSDAERPLERDAYERNFREIFRHMGR